MNDHVPARSRSEIAARTVTAASTTAPPAIAHGEGCGGAVVVERVEEG